MASGGLVALFWEATPESEFRRIPSASSVGTRYFRETPQAVVVREVVR